jgi:hypothetical protein
MPEVVSRLSPFVLVDICTNGRSYRSLAQRNWQSQLSGIKELFPNLSFSLRFLRILCVSAIELASNLFTAESQRMQRKRRDFRLGYDCSSVKL